MIGTDWSTTTSALLRRGSNCQSKVTAGEEFLVCSLDLGLDFVSTSSVRMENRAGTGVSVVRLEAYSTEVVARCRGIMELTRTSLKNSGWMIGQLRSERTDRGRAWRLSGELNRDKEVIAVCSPQSGFWVRFADAWLGLPSGRPLVPGTGGVAGEVVLDTIIRHKTAGEVLGSRTDTGQVVDLLISPDLEEQFSVARAAAGRVSARSRAEFDRHVATVTARQWLIRNYTGLKRDGTVE